jgi:hypothetical protein
MQDLTIEKTMQKIELREKYVYLSFYKGKRATDYHFHPELRRSYILCFCSKTVG